jgi:hypothetical protein
VLTVGLHVFKHPVGNIAHIHFVSGCSYMYDGSTCKVRARVSRTCSYSILKKSVSLVDCDNNNAKIDYLPIHC